MYWAKLRHARLQVQCALVAVSLATVLVGGCARNSPATASTTLPANVASFGPPLSLGGMSVVARLFDWADSHGSLQGYPGGVGADVSTPAIIHAMSVGTNGGVITGFVQGAPESANVDCGYNYELSGFVRDHMLVLYATADPGSWPNPRAACPAVALERKTSTLTLTRPLQADDVVVDAITGRVVSRR